MRITLLMILLGDVLEICNEPNYTSSHVRCRFLKLLLIGAIKMVILKGCFAK